MFFCFLLDISDLLRHLLQSVLVIGVLQLELCAGLATGISIAQRHVGKPVRKTYPAAAWGSLALG